MYSRYIYIYALRGALSFQEKVQSHPEKVKVYGPGICEGRVGEKGVFTIETADAGPGQMSVRVLGPKKSIVVSQMPHPTIDYAIIVEYNPTNAGSYVIEVEWSGTHVSGSPFTVNVVDGTEVYLVPIGYNSCWGVDSLRENAQNHVYINSSNDEHPYSDIQIRTFRYGLLTVRIKMSTICI